MTLNTSPLLSFIVAALVRTLAWTWRFRVVDQAGVMAAGGAMLKPLIWVFWHNRLLVVPVLYERFFRNRKSAVLISRSRDGGILSGIIERFGGEPVRGSSSRGGASALRELQRRVNEGNDAYITPDGPKGPRYSVSPGALWLATTTGADLLPVSIEFSRVWRLGRWDGFIIPRPFSRVTVTLRERHSVPTGLEGEAMKQEQDRLREIMLEETEMR